MLKRKAKRLGKKTFKFRFVVTVHSVDITHDEWTRTPMILQWMRHSRNVATDPSSQLQGNKTQTHAEWDEPLGMVVTLYKEDKAKEYEEKKYTFTLYEAKANKISKPLAHVELNLADYASAQPSTHLLSVQLVPINKKLEKVMLHVTLRCEAAVASDGDSTFDAMSDTSSMHFREDDAQALDEDDDERGGGKANSPSAAAAAAAAESNYDEQYAATVSDIKEKAKPSKLQREVERLHEDDLQERTPEQLRKYVLELKRLLDKEKTDHEDMLNSLLMDYANNKVRLAQSEYERERTRLEKSKALKQVAQMKLKVIEQQEKLTKLEVRLAKTG